jgi:hypothetical protein
MPASAPMGRPSTPSLSSFAPSGVQTGASTARSRTISRIIDANREFVSFARTKASDACIFPALQSRHRIDEGALHDLLKTAR